eukprot:scaffold47515_cov60-Phaeocystis_antarctica.AAC.2
MNFETRAIRISELQLKLLECFTDRATASTIIIMVSAKWSRAGSRPLPSGSRVFWSKKDPRGAGELAGTATGYAFVVHGFACLE